MRGGRGNPLNHLRLRPRGLAGLTAREVRTCVIKSTMPEDLRSGLCAISFHTFGLVDKRGWYAK
eukprot:9082066-Pyramimonas_sp.AAC.1